MTREELLTVLRSLRGVDPEWAHGEADDALLSYIDDQDVSAAFDELERVWSA